MTDKSIPIGAGRNVEPELLEQLGHLVVRWGYLEELISQLFVWVVEGDPASMTIVTANISTATLAQWTRSVLDARTDYSDQANEVRAILAEFEEVRLERNPLVHGVWSTGGPPMSAIVQTVRLDRGAIIHEIVVTAADLHSLVSHVLDVITTLHEFLSRVGVKV